MKFLLNKQCKNSLSMTVVQKQICLKTTQNPRTMIPTLNHTSTTREKKRKKLLKMQNEIEVKFKRGN